MKKEEVKLYINAHPKEQYSIYSGMNFHDFINGVPAPINNIMLLRGNYIGEKRKYRFELLEGEDDIKKLMRKDIYRYGDFCFVDYEKTTSLDGLTNEQIAELLYMAHMFKPLKKPFFEVLGNRFVYLAHDDSYYCKLYCRDVSIIVTLLFKKIAGYLKRWLKAEVCEFSDETCEVIYGFMQQGLFIDLAEVNNAKEAITLTLYVIGAYENIDNILNNCRTVKHTALAVRSLRYQSGEWTLL